MDFEEPNTPKKAEKPPERTMLLPVKLGDVELALRAQELATAEGKMGEEELRLDRFVESAKETKKGIENEIDEARQDVRRLGRIVRSRTEDRDVPVEERHDFKSSSVSTFRLDTNELVKTRGMYPEERQRALFEAQKAKRAGEKEQPRA